MPYFYAPIFTVYVCSVNRDFTMIVQFKKQNAIHTEETVSEIVPFLFSPPWCF